MARRASGVAESTRGGSDVLGILLVSLALLTAIALFTFDKADLAINRVPPNTPTHNWAGQFGAASAYFLFFVFGAAAYLLPVLVLGFGLAQFMDSLGYLRRRWPWAILLVLVCAAAFDTGTDTVLLEKLAKGDQVTPEGVLERLALNLNVGSAGGALGANLNRYIFGYFGKVGSGVLFVTLWVIGLYGLTNFRLGEWIRSILSRREPSEIRLSDEKALERRASELEREAKRLQEELEKSARVDETEQGRESTEGPPVGPDLRPVPEPTVRDLSIPQVKRGEVSASGKTPESEETRIEIDEVIPASEV
ncbi:MAG: DNA translocase FtsK 4TM domain-containing protein, partial [Verrucomicrobiae bacterium]|nr:DNA translocase FtsK 4TM domain-containing protein [Verrucomicrobiae bacterium]